VLSGMVSMCSLFGLPWFVAATVRAITHVRSLVTESDVKAPGDRPQMLGVRSVYQSISFIYLLFAVLQI